MRCHRPVVPAFLFLTLITPHIFAQQFQSCEVNDDRTVTFRLNARTASEVEVNVARTEIGPVKLAKQESGRWEGRSPQLPPGIYEYSFKIDGNTSIDPRNRWIKEWYSLMSMFEIPGEVPLVTERQTVPHGVLHHHTYLSAVTGSERDVIVYTPPGYEKSPNENYPVVYLLHGFGDDQTAWTKVGRAHNIADNLIAQGSVAPLVIVMPYGHPEPLPYGQRDPAYGAKNDRLMEKDLLTQVKPLVASTYRIRQEATQTAIVGLSMGGGHSLRIGMRNPSEFAYVGAFSAAAPDAKTISETFPSLDKDKSKFSKIWIACGDKDFLLDRNRSFTTKLEELEVPHEYVETKGSHNWDVWRDYLPKFLQLVFR